MTGITTADERRIYYYLVWPTTFLSIHPDYLLVHRLIPQGPDRTLVTCDWLFEPSTMALPDFDPSDAIAFWDLTNSQDWHVCELQQRGTRSSTWIAGRYSNQESPVHMFDRMVADRYAGDPFRTTRFLLELGETPFPSDDRQRTSGNRAGSNGRNAENGHGPEGAPLPARTASRAKANAPS